MTKQAYYDVMDTEIGPLTLTWSAKGLVSAMFKKDAPAKALGLKKGDRDNPYRTAFAAYFKGDKNPFLNMPFDMEGTKFQRQVWALLLKIPAGETRCYGDLAAALGKPKASRAVGWANGQNPISIAVPCHRVIGKDGTLTGYAGGLKRKAWLLDHEGARFKAFV